MEKLRDNETPCESYVTLVTCDDALAWANFLEDLSLHFAAFTLGPFVVVIMVDNMSYPHSRLFVGESVSVVVSGPHLQVLESQCVRPV